jgi:hypothetical protein
MGSFSHSVVRSISQLHCTAHNSQRTVDIGSRVKSSIMEQYPKRPEMLTVRWLLCAPLVLYRAFWDTIRGSNVKRFGLAVSILALTQCVLRAPKVSTRVKFARTPSPGPFSGLSTLK